MTLQNHSEYIDFIYRLQLSESEINKVMESMGKEREEAQAQPVPRVINSRIDGLDFAFYLVSTFRCLRYSQILRALANFSGYNKPCNAYFYAATVFHIFRSTYIKTSILFDDEKEFAAINPNVSSSMMMSTILSFWVFLEMFSFQPRSSTQAGFRYLSRANGEGIYLPHNIWFIDNSKLYDIYDVSNDVKGNVMSIVQTIKTLPKTDYRSIPIALILHEEDLKTIEKNALDAYMIVAHLNKKMFLGTDAEKKFQIHYPKITFYEINNNLPVVKDVDKSNC